MRVIAFRAAQRTESATRVPIIAAQLIVRGGASAESEADAGLAALMASLLTQGHDDALGRRDRAGRSTGSARASTPRRATTRRTYRVTALTPTCSENGVRAVRRDRAPAVVSASRGRTRAREGDRRSRVQLQQPERAGAASSRSASRSGRRRTAIRSPGTAETLATLDREHIAAFHARYFRPDNATLIVGGDCVPEEAFALAERQFGGWRAPSEPLPVAAPFTAPAPRSRVVIVDKPDAGRTAVVAGRVGIARRAPEYAAGVVATAVLSGYSGRLNQEVRVKRGLSYGASAQLIARREPGLFLASTLVDHTKVGEAVGVVLETLHGLAATAPEAAELVTRKATISGSFSRSIETIDGIAGVLGELALYGVPLTELGDYLPEIEAVDPAMVQRFAAATFDELFVVLVGDARNFAEAIAKTYPNVTTIPFANLDLGRPDATKT